MDGFKKAYQFYRKLSVKILTWAPWLFGWLRSPTHSKMMSLIDLQLWPDQETWSLKPLKNRDHLIILPQVSYVQYPSQTQMVTVTNLWPSQSSQSNLKAYPTHSLTFMIPPFFGFSQYLPLSSLGFTTTHGSFHLLLILHQTDQVDLLNSLTASSHNPNQQITPKHHHPPTQSIPTSSPSSSSTLQTSYKNK